jgi:TM2 domain-containing membrane protein YozV
MRSPVNYEGSNFVSQIQWVLWEDWSIIQSLNVDTEYFSIYDIRDPLNDNERMRDDVKSIERRGKMLVFKLKDWEIIKFDCNSIKEAVQWLEEAKNPNIYEEFDVNYNWVLNDIYAKTDTKIDYINDSKDMIEMKRELLSKRIKERLNPTAKKNNNLNKRTATILCLFLGWLWCHQFYLRNYGRGTLYLIFCWTFIPAIISIYDLIILITTSKSKFDNLYNQEHIEHKETLKLLKEHLNNKNLVSN